MGTLALNHLFDCLGPFQQVRLGYFPAPTRKFALLRLLPAPPSPAQEAEDQRLADRVQRRDRVA
jgi:hypothetical protein